MVEITNRRNKKLSDDQVRLIRQRYFNEEHLTMTQLAKQFNVSYGCINLILHNKTWTDLD